MYISNHGKPESIFIREHKRVVIGGLWWCNDNMPHGSVKMADHVETITTYTDTMIYLVIANWQIRRYSNFDSLAIT